MDDTSYVYEYCLGGAHRPPKCIAQTPVFEPGRFLRSVKWSPDGMALAAVSESGALDIYDMSPAVAAYCGGLESGAIGAPALSVPHASTPLALAWYPHMRRDAPETCCVVESVRDHPIQLRDSVSGYVRATYTARDDSDVLMAASALEFVDGGRFVAGVANSLALFDLLRPGLPLALDRLEVGRREGVRGLVSCVAGRGGLVACATFAGHLGLRAGGDLGPVAAWRVPVEYAGAGVVDLRWSSDFLLWAAQRRGRFVVAWDIRDLRSPVMTVERPAGNQRMAIDFDPSGSHLVAGTVDGELLFSDTRTGERLLVDDRVAPSEMTRLSQFMADCMSVGALRGFAHFSVHIRSREEIILRIHPPSDTLPISSLTISEHVDKVQATEESRGLFQRTSGMEMAPDLSDYALELDTGVNFLVAGYPRYKCPYVWLRTDHQRLVVPAEEGQDVEKDVPLRLESIDCWRLYDIRPWDVMVEVICTAVVPPPENPFAVDYAYFERITREERVVLTGALLEFLRRVYLRHYFFSDVVMADIRCLQKLHFRDINVLREYQQSIVFRDQSS
ncbi:hypothetical protein GGI06_000423 [Coemansia sp. S85]|nr:hypothetical protein GGI06_000423 [Coemansia sp. S85]